MKLYKEIPAIEEVIKVIESGALDKDYILQQYAFSIIDECAKKADVIWNGAVNRDSVLKVKNQVK